MQREGAAVKNAIGSGFRKRRACVLALALIGAGAVPSMAGAVGTLERIQASNTIVIAHRAASIPLSYVSDGQPVGYSVDLCRKIADAIATQLGLRRWSIAFKEVTSSTRFDVIERGEADLECGSTTNTAARRARVAFTIPHFIASSRLMTLSSKPYERIEDLDQQTLASTKGTTNVASLALEARVKSLTIKIVEATDHAEAVSWVRTGRVEGFAMDDVLLFGLRADSPRPQELKVIGKPITIEPYAIAFERNNPGLKRIVDAEMRRLIGTRQLHQLYDKWFMQPIPPRGIELKMRMPHLLSDSFKYPTDYVPPN
jgi:ABC-type amino acid transport substrate-binding protein